MPQFYRSPTWKHLLTNRDSLVVSDLSRLASNRSARFELGAPATLTGHVPSDDFRVYFPSDDNFELGPADPFWLGSSGNIVDFPRLEEGLRLMYSFRRDGAEGDGAPWTIRHAGPVLELNDDANPSRRLSRFTVYDPWQYLYRRPCRLAELVNTIPDPDPTSMPGDPGVVFPGEFATTGDQVVCELLRRTIDQDGLTYIDAGVAFGGTAFYSGTIETTEAFEDPIIFPRGMSVGEAWDQMVDTGTLDIVLTPIWDPFNRPGYCAELNVFNHAGALDGQGPFDTVLEAFPVFHWDRVGRSLIEISRFTDGRERANRIRAFQGGTGAQNAPWTQVLDGGSGDDDAASVSDFYSRVRYGEYWHQETYVRQARTDTVKNMAHDELARRRVAHRGWTFRPTPEFSPRPFQDYMPGSFVGFSHSSKLRAEQWWLPHQFNDQEIFPRIFGFTLNISDSSLETVTSLDVGIDDRPGV